METKTRTGILGVVAVLAVAVLGAAVADEKPAERLFVAPPAFLGIEVSSLRSYPATFRVILTRETPSPGWRFEIDSVEVEEDSPRILVRITEVAPTGKARDVVTLSKVEFSIPALARGRYLLEVRTRADKSAEHGLAQTWVLGTR